MLADLSVAGTFGDFIHLGACLRLMVSPALGAFSGQTPGALREGLCTHPNPLPGWMRPAHLHLPILHMRGAALHVAVVAAARAALHLHAGRPHQEVSIGAVYEAPRDLKHLRARLALRDHGWLCLPMCDLPWHRPLCLPLSCPLCFPIKSKGASTFRCSEQMSLVVPSFLLFPPSRPG